MLFVLPWPIGSAALDASTVQYFAWRSTTFPALGPEMADLPTTLMSGSQDCFAFFDEARSRGADLKLATNARAMVAWLHCCRVAVSSPRPRAHMPLLARFASGLMLSCVALSSFSLRPSKPRPTPGDSWAQVRQRQAHASDWQNAPAGQGPDAGVPSVAGGSSPHTVQHSAHVHIRISTFMYVHVSVCIHACIYIYIC